MATLLVQKATLGLSGSTYSGLTPTYNVAAAGGDQFVAGNLKRTYLHVKNGHSSPQDVTIGAVKKCDQGHSHAITVAVPNAAEKIIGPLDDSVRGLTGNVLLTYSAVTALTVAIVELADAGR